MTSRMDWINIGAVVVGSAVTVARTVMDYNRFRRDQESLEYTRNLQRAAWKKVMSGELAEAKVSDMHLRAPDPDKPLLGEKDDRAPSKSTVDDASEA